MSQDQIFWIRPNEAGRKALAPLQLDNFKDEVNLQKLIEEHPQLIPGDQMGEAETRKWLPVCRELPIPDSENHARTLSADHLFLDQDGIPTLIEDKLGKNLEVRRKVVAQILDYAAHVRAFFSRGTLRDLFAKKYGEGSDILIHEHFDRDPDTYWRDVDDNLNAGRMRLLVVADEISPQLHRIVEFLNEQMRDVTFLAVEIRRYKGPEESHILVPQVFGMTARAVVKKVAAGKTTRDEFLAALTENGHSFFKKLLERADQRQELSINWGTKGFSLSLILDALDTNTKALPLCYGYPPTSSYQQSLYTAFGGRGGMAGKVIFPEQERRALVEETGLFQPAGKDWKCMIDQHFTPANEERLLTFIDHLIKTGEEASLKPKHKESS